MKHAGGDVPGFDRTCKQSILNILLWFLFPRGLSGGLLLLVLLAVSFFGVVTTNAETVAPSNSLALIGSSAPTEYRLYLPSVRLTIPPISSPVMKWQHAGCYSSWCETGWYSSPAVADLEGDGSIEVIGSTYTIFVFDGPTGNLEWRVKSGHDRTENPDSVSNVGRTWAGIVVTDVDNDNQLELVTAHHEGYVSIYNHNGYFESGWPKRLTPGWEMRSLAVGDVDGNGDREILVCSTRSNDQWFMLEHTGATRSGWPVHSPDSDTNGYAAGCYNQNVSLGDIDGDNRDEMVGPNDTHYIVAFNDNATPIRASAIYGSVGGQNKPWARVGVHVEHAVDLRGWANCGSDHRPNFAGSAPIMVDVNGDGVLEIVVVGNVYNCGTNPYTSLYEMPYIFNADRTRWSGSGYDWTVLPTPDGNAGPLSEDWLVIESNQPNPVAADLDSDGYLEILYPSYDGRMHAYWLDKTEHGNWPYSIYNPSDGFYRFASEPVVADLNSDGLAEVLFSSWVQKGTNRTGKLHILDFRGNPLHEIDLPMAYKSSWDWNGGLAAPTLANIDGDSDLEIVLNTSHSGFVAYDLPGTAGARILWGTGRGSYLRAGHP
jgi:hypothetical protein